jgi:Family of unknown function (DUF6229)
MPKMTDAHVDAILAGWLSGSESVDGLANPAGPLYVGGTATEAALADAAPMMGTGCSICTASRPVVCC